MRRHLLIPAAVAGGLLLPSTAGAEIVKAPTGETQHGHGQLGDAQNAQEAQAHAVRVRPGQEVRLHEADDALQPLALGLRDPRGRRGALRQEHGLPAQARQALGARRPPATRARHAAQRLRHGADRQRADQVLHRLRHRDARRPTPARSRRSPASSSSSRRPARTTSTRRSSARRCKRFSQFGTMDLRLIKPPASSSGTTAPGTRRPVAASATVTPGPARRRCPAAAPSRPLLPGTRSTPTATASRTAACRSSRSTRRTSTSTRTPARSTSAAA